MKPLFYFFSCQKTRKNTVFVIACYNKSDGQDFQQNKELNSHKGFLNSLQLNFFSFLFLL